MKTLTMTVELEFDDELMYGGDEDPEAKEWFFDSVLTDAYGQLFLHSNEIGDTVGVIRILEKETR